MINMVIMTMQILIMSPEVMSLSSGAQATRDGRCTMPGCRFQHAYGYSLQGGAVGGGCSGLG